MRAILAAVVLAVLTLGGSAVQAEMAPPWKTLEPPPPPGMPPRSGTYADPFAAKPQLDLTVKPQRKAKKRKGKKKRR